MDKQKHREEVIREYLKNSDKYLKDRDSTLSPLENFLIDKLFETEEELRNLKISLQFRTSHY